MAMFWFNVLQGVGGIVSIYFTQYYMKDVVMMGPHGFHVAGFSHSLCTTAEAATSLFSLVQSVAFMVTSLAGGIMADRLGKKPIVVVATVGQGVGFAALGYTDNFTAVLALAIFGGLAAGLGNGPMMALQAESLPNTRDAGRDFNLLTNAFTICQIVVPPLCGYALDAYSGGSTTSSSTSGGGMLDVVESSPDAGSGGDSAYRLIWSVAGALNVLALPLLCFIYPPQELHDVTDETLQGSGSGMRTPVDGTITSVMMNSKGERERTIYANMDNDYWYQKPK
jgi:MFS family permease